MRLSQLSSIFLIRFGLAAAFAANVLREIFQQQAFYTIIESSKVFPNLPDIMPNFIYVVVAANDFVIALFLIVGIFGRLVSLWAAIWILVVIIFQLSSVSMSGVIDAVELLALLFMSIYLFVKYGEIERAKKTSDPTSRAVNILSEALSSQKAA